MSEVDEDRAQTMMEEVDPCDKDKAQNDDASFSACMHEVVQRFKKDAMFAGAVYGLEKNGKHPILFNGGTRPFLRNE